MKKVTTFCEYWKCPHRQTDVYLTGYEEGPYCSLREDKKYCIGDNGMFPSWCPLEDAE